MALSSVGNKTVLEPDCRYSVYAPALGDSHAVAHSRRLRECGVGTSDLDFFSASLCAFWIVAFLSATHDIAADGFYMLGLNENRQSFFVGIRSLFYRLALVVGQGALVVFAGYLEARSSSANSAWMLIFFMISGAFLLLALYHSAVLPHPEADRRRDTRTVSDVVREFGATFRTFFTRKGIGIALAFMLLYRFPEAQLLKLISPFLLDSLRPEDWDSQPCR